VVDFRLAAALVIGANIGTTIDAFLASLGTKVAARRTAWVHILFNVFGSVWAIILFGPFLKLVDWLWPGPVEASVAQHIAMLHTVFNTINALLFLPFMDQLAGLVTRLVRVRPGEEERARLVYIAAPIVSSPELNLLAAQKEIADMAGLARDMFASVRDDTRNPGADHAANLEEYGRLENYADQMREELAKFLLECAGREMSEASQNNVGLMLRIVDELESVTDQAYSLALIIERTRKKGIVLPKDEIDSLQPYGLLVEQFLRFVSDNVNKPITEEQLSTAADFEDKIDAMRDELKRRARKRLSAGAEVKAELAVIDLVRHIEKIGDHAFGVARALREFR
jgi:phosphate:Na+ symporter